MGQPRKYSIPDHVISEVLDGETVVLNLRSGKYFALNKTATRMWQLLREQAGPDALCHRVASEFAANPERVKSDFAALLADLAKRGLIEVE